MKQFKKLTATLLSLALVLTLLMQGSVSATSNTASASDDDAVIVQESASAEIQNETTDDTTSDKDAETAEAADDTAADAADETAEGSDDAEDDADGSAAEETGSGADENTAAEAAAGTASDAADDTAAGNAAGTTGENTDITTDTSDGGEVLSAGTAVTDTAAAGSVSADELTDETAAAAESGETIEESVIAEEASGDTTSSSIDLSTFMSRLQSNSWTYDGSTADEASDGVLTVQWSPDSSNAGTQVNSNNLQYYLANESASAGNTVDVSISNVSFVYEAADFTLNDTTYSASTYKTAQMYFMNCGNLTVNNCSFKNVVLTHWLSCSDSTHSSTVTNCTFNNTNTGQAGIKDLRGSYITVTGCTFIGCETGIRVSQSGTSVTVYSVNLSNNTFTTLQSGGNLFDLADPSGNYANASIVINNNVADAYTIANCTTFSIKSALTSGGNFTIGLMTGDITDIVNESGTIKYQTAWGVDLGQSTVNKITFASDADSAAEYYRYIFANTSYTLPDADVVTAKDGYSFAGWTTDGNTVYAAGDTVTVTAAAAYYALWTCDHASYTGEVTKEATCTEDGLMTYTCSSCGDDSYTEVIAATGHTWNTTPDSESWEQTDSGYTVTLVFSCSVCGATKTVTQSVEFSSSSSGTDSDSDSGVTYTITSESKTAANGDTYTIYTALITIGSVSYTSQTTAAYSVTDGTEQTISSDDTLTVTGSGTAAQFTSLTIDGVTVDAAYYALDEATGEITVSSEYLATLDAGEHTLTLVYADGTASTSFTVEETSAGTGETADETEDGDTDDENADSDDTSDDADSSDDSTDTLTKTGDSTGIGLWVVLLIAAAAAAAIVLAVYFARMPRKSRSSRRARRRRR